MALLDMDTFNWCNTEAIMQQGRLSEGTSSGNNIAKPYQGLGFRWSTNQGGPCFHNDRTARIITGCLYQADGSHTVVPVFRVIGDNSEQFQIHHSLSGHWKVMRGSSTLIGSAIAAGGYGRLFMDRYSWIELDITFSNTIGTVEMWINGEKILDLSGLDNWAGTGTPAVDYFLWATGVTSVSTMSSVYQMDASGLTNNAVIGPWDIEMISPDGDGNRNDFAPDSGLTNWDRVDETAHDGDTSYVFDTVVDNDELYTYAALVGSYDTVFGVQVSSMLKKLSGGERLVRQLARSNVSEAESVAQGVPIDYSRNQGIFETDPNGGGAWTVAAVDAAEFGLTIES